MAFQRVEQEVQVNLALQRAFRLYRHLAQVLDAKPPSGVQGMICDSPTAITFSVLVIW